MKEIAHPSIHSIKARRVPSLIDISDGPSPSSFHSKRSANPLHSKTRKSPSSNWDYGSFPQSINKGIKDCSRSSDSTSTLWQFRARQIESELNSPMYSPCENIPMHNPSKVNRIKALTLKNRALPTLFPPGNTEQPNSSVSNINTRPAKYSNPFTTPPGSGNTQLSSMEGNPIIHAYSSNVSAPIQKKNPNQFNQLLHYEIQ